MWQMKMNDTLKKQRTLNIPSSIDLSQILQYCMDVDYIKEFENNP